jgi:hypothetical protein
MKKQINKRKGTTLITRNCPTYTLQINLINMHTAHAYTKLFLSVVLNASQVIPFSGRQCHNGISIQLVTRFADGQISRNTSVHRDTLLMAVFWTVNAYSVLYSLHGVKQPVRETGHTTYYFRG